MSEHCLGLVLMVLRGDKLTFLSPAGPVASITKGRGMMGAGEAPGWWGGWAAGGSAAQVLLGTSAFYAPFPLSVSSLSPGAQSPATDTCSLSKPCLCPRAAKWKSLGMSISIFETPQIIPICSHVGVSDLIHPPSQGCLHFQRE